MLRDDLGRTWDLLRESPAAIEAAVADAVRRWRFARILRQFPAAVPSTHDCTISACGDEGRALVGRTVVADAGILLGSLVRTRPAKVDGVPAWDAVCRPWLVSAITGGQWPQSRRAAVRAWDADSRCQLCMADTGTLIHRRSCPATVPAGGWAATLPAVAEFLARLGPERLHLLRTRALLAVRVPAPVVADDAMARWRSEVPDLTRSDLVFYTDGSFLHSRYREFSTAGCAVVIVSSDGVLVGVVEARLPSRVGTASEAEARALLLAVTRCPFMPFVITDCQSLLTTAQGGLASATAANRPMAGVWTLIGSALDGDTAAAVNQGRLVWMPAHLTRATAGAMRKSDGSPVSVVDWRANRLADAVAKSAAGAPLSTTHAVRCLKSAGDAHRHEAAVLGAVTCAANTHRVQIITASGNSTTVVKRDSVATAAAPRSVHGRAPEAARRGTSTPLAAPAASVGTTRRPLRPHCASADILARAKFRRVATLAAVAARARDERVAIRILDDAAAVRAAAGAAVGDRPAPVLDASDDDDVGRALAAAVTRVRARSSEVSPHDRMAALRVRIAARQQLAPCGAGSGGTS